MSFVILLVLNDNMNNGIADIDIISDSNSNCCKIDTASMFSVDISPPYGIKSYSVELVGGTNEKEYCVFLGRRNLNILFN